MGDSTNFDITWHHGAYYVSIPNYSGGTVYTAEHVARLTRENEAMRKALESTEMQAVVQQAIMRHPHWGMASGPTSAYGFAGSALKAIVAAISSLKEPGNAQT